MVMLLRDLGSYGVISTPVFITLEFLVFLDRQIASVLIYVISLGPNYSGLTTKLVHTNNR
jgi:hypothetical protein